MSASHPEPGLRSRCRAWSRRWGRVGRWTVLQLRNQPVAAKDVRKRPEEPFAVHGMEELECVRFNHMQAAESLHEQAMEKMDVFFSAEQQVS
jgi:hypothetical protein